MRVRGKGQTVLSGAGIAIAHVERNGVGVGSVCEIIPGGLRRNVLDTRGSHSDPHWSTENKTWCLC